MPYFIDPALTVQEHIVKEMLPIFLKMYNFYDPMNA
jgi:hypothetical protein